MELAVVGGLAATSLYLRLTIEKRKKDKIKRDWNELMQELKLYTKGSQTAPAVKKVEFIENGFILNIKIPSGLNFKNIEEVKEDIENKFEGLIFINQVRFSSTICIKVITKDIGEFPYAPVKTESWEIYIGKTFDWSDYTIDVNKVHILGGGATGTGKSFLLSVILVNLIYNSTNEIEIHLGQILKGELGIFKNCKPVTFASENLEEIANDLEKISKIIDARSKYFARLGIKNLKHYSKHYKHKKIKRIFYIIEELSFFMASDNDDKEVKELKNKCWDNILTIVKAGRSSGIHLIALTQRTTVTNLPSDVKSQMCRISLRQISKIDSKNIIECEDAINLLDRECLVYGTSKAMEIVKMPYVDEDFESLRKYVKEIITPNNVVKDIKKTSMVHGIKTIIVSDTPRELPLVPVKKDIPEKEEVVVVENKKETTDTLEEAKEPIQEIESKNVLYQRPTKKPKKPKKGMIKIEDR